MVNVLDSSKPLKSSFIVGSTSIDDYENKISIKTFQNHAKEEPLVNETGMLDCIAYAMATLSESKPKGIKFQYTNDDYTLTINATSKFGLPYGSSLRLLLVLIIHEITLTKSPVLRVGKIYSRCLRELKLSKYSDRKSGDVCIYDQMLRLFSSHISFTYKNEEKNDPNNKFVFHQSFDFWWNPIKVNITPSSTIVLSKEFFKEVMNLSTLQEMKVAIKDEGFILKPFQSHITAQHSMRGE